MEKAKVIRIAVVSVILLVSGIYGFKKINHALHYESTDNAQVETKSTPVLARVAGYIDSINVEDYASVEKGQILVNIDKREYEIAVAQAEADLFQSQADFENAQAAYANALQNVKVASANADLSRVRIAKAESDFARDKNLFKDESITQKQLEDSKSNFDVQQKRLPPRWSKRN